VHLDGYDVAYLAGVKVVDVAHVVILIDDGLNPVLGFLGEALLEQLARGLTQEGDGGADDEDADDDGGNGVEDGPSLSQQ